MNYIKKVFFANMIKVIRYIVVLFVGILIGFKACDFINYLKYRIEVQEFRNTKTTNCLIIKKDKELTVN